MIYRCDNCGATSSADKDGRQLLGIDNDIFVLRGWVYIKVWIKDRKAIETNDCDGLNAYYCKKCAHIASPVIALVNRISPNRQSLWRRFTKLVRGALGRVLGHNLEGTDETR